MADASLDIAEQVARILRSNEETQTFVAEQRKLMAEQTKLQAEAAKLERVRMLAPWQNRRRQRCGDRRTDRGTAALSLPVTPDRFRECLTLLCWPQQGLAGLFESDDRMVRR